MVVGANKGGGQAFRGVMQRPAVPGTVGYVSVFVELFAWVATGERGEKGLEGWEEWEAWEECMRSYQSLSVGI